MGEELFVKGEHCGCEIRMLKYVKPHVGAYCARCTVWIKWLSKKEKAEHNIVTPNYVKKEPNGEIVDELNRLLDTDIDDEVPWYD